MAKAILSAGAAKVKSDIPKRHHYIVRLVSSRGIDVTNCFWFRRKLTKDELREFAEDWGKDYTAGTVIHSYSVLYYAVKVADRRELLRKYDLSCDRLRKAQIARDKAGAMLTPVERFI